jgi:hypothetical protein
MTSDRYARMSARVHQLIDNFQYYLECYEARPAFDHRQLTHHLEALRLREALGGAEAAARDPAYARSLKRTLGAWGLNQRGSRLVDDGLFAAALAERADDIARLAPLRIADDMDDGTIRTIWHIAESLAITDNLSRLVPATKALHHLLPDLVVPMDREYTQLFFGWHGPEIQGGATVFVYSFAWFRTIARAVDPARFVGRHPWNTSVTKVVDNAIVGFRCHEISRAA